MLSESLVLSHFDYALPVWGPPLQKCQVSRLQQLQNRAVWVTKSLRKYDRVSSHCHNLNWLPVSHQIKLRSVCVMFRYCYQRGTCLQLDTPIQYGWRHSYLTRRGNFASITLCCLASTKSNFRSAATTWWNSLPSHIHDCNLNLGNFMKAVRNLYVTVFWKTDHLDTRTEIHLLPVRDRHTHALSRNTKH